MKREIDIKAVSDGRFYDINDMVKADCGDCQGCSACCRGMGESIVLDPLDIFRMTKGLSCTFEALLEDKIELQVVDGIILPNLKMAGDEEACAFLNEKGRCIIHSFRPGICRIFPLGRYYEEGRFQYFLQVYECKKENRAKVKVKKWIDTPDVKTNEAFILKWHYFLKDVQERLEKSTDEAYIKNVNLYILKLFYMKPYDMETGFYEQFEERFAEAGNVLN